MSGGLSSKGYHGQGNGSKQKNKWFSWTTCRQEPHAKLKDFSVLLMEICISWLQGRLNEAACDEFLSEKVNSKGIRNSNAKIFAGKYQFTSSQNADSQVIFQLKWLLCIKKQYTWEWDLALQRASPSLKENTWQLGHGAFTVAYLLWLAVNYRKCMQIIIMEWKERRSRRGLLPDHFRDV